MIRIVDLSMPIEDHFRWPVEQREALRGEAEGWAQPFGPTMNAGGDGKASRFGHL